MKTLERNSTGANGGNRDRNFSVLSLSSSSNPVEIDFNLINSEGVNIYSRRDGDAEVSQFSDEITVNCAPLV